MRLPEVFKRQFKDLELVRMSNGDYCLVRPLGLVPGGKGMRYHENVLRLTATGIASKLWGGLRQGSALQLARALAAARSSSALIGDDTSALGLKPSPQRLRATARD